MTESTLLEQGMLLLPPADAPASESGLWTVSRVGKKSATILQHYGSMMAEARLGTAHLPPGWRIVKAKTLARLIHDGEFA
jgi:hypothetical protein